MGRGEVLTVALSLHEEEWSTPSALKGGGSISKLYASLCKLCSTFTAFSNGDSASTVISWANPLMRRAGPGQLSVAVKDVNGVIPYPRHATARALPRRRRKL